VDESKAVALELDRGADRAGNVYADPARAYPELVEHRTPL